jgi:hypothetical protein
MTSSRVRAQEQDARDAANSFKVVQVDRTAEVTYVEAEAPSTFNRYVVIATKMPPAGRRREGGDVLVTVISPWDDANVMQYGPEAGHLHTLYVAEKLTDGRERRGELNWGNLVGLVLTIGEALQRPVSPLLDLGVSLDG